MAYPLFKASYSRGNKKAEFFVDTIDSGFGRRGKLHQTPFNDVPFFEDLGRKGRVFTVSGHVMPDGSGADETYENSRDLLIEVIEKYKGSGVFIHPTMGAIRVVPTSDCVFKFDNSKGRIEYFTITFSEEGNKPIIGKSTRDAIVVAVQDCVQKQIDTYIKSTGTTGKNEVLKVEDFIGYGNATIPFFPSQEQTLPDSFLDKVKKTIAVFQAKVATIVAKVKTVSSTVQAYADEFANLQKALTAIPDAIAGTISSVYNTIQNSLTSLSILTQNPFDNIFNSIGLFDIFFSGSGDKVKKYKTLKIANDSYGSYTHSTNTLEYRAIKSELSTDIMIMTSVINIAGITIVEAEFENTEQVEEIRSLMNDRIEKLVLLIGEMEVQDSYSTLINLQVTLNNDLIQRSQRLPDITVIKNRINRPSLVIAYNEYGDATKNNEFVSRNKIANPNKVPIGEFEVIR